MELPIILGFQLVGHTPELCLHGLDTNILTWLLDHLLPVLSFMLLKIFTNLMIRYTGQLREV